MKRKTHDEYIEELKIKNPNVCALEQYVNANTKIEHKCLIHNICWKTTPSRVLQGCGCEKCHTEKIITSKTRTHEEYLEQLNKINSNIIPLEKYITGKVPILHYCKKHDIIWNVIPDNILAGHGCYKCGNEKIGLNNTIPFDQYQKELESKFPNLECIGNYINHTTPVLHKCKICGYEWETQPIYILKGIGCKKCMGTLIRSTQEYIDDLYQINPQIELVDEFVNMTTPVLHRCKIHNYTWNVVPSSIMNGTGCPICGRGKMSLTSRKSHEEFLKELNDANPNIICIGEYIKSDSKIKVKCVKCGETWDALPYNLLNGHGCPTCNISRGENRIKHWLDNNNIDYITQKRFENCKDKRILPFDFYLPEYNIAIEYDGEQHSKAIDWFGGKDYLDYMIRHDKIKTKYCKDNNIELLRISYKDNIESKLNSLFI